MKFEYPFDYFDRIYCINLDKRKDRWEHLNKELDKIELLKNDDYERISAIEMKDGRVGLIKTVGKIIDKAIKNEYSNILIIEDDCKFINNSLNILDYAIEDLSNLDWDLFYLGANTHTKLEKKTKHLSILKSGFATHAVAYNSKVFEKILNYTNTIEHYIKNQGEILDVWLSQNIQTLGNSYVCNPIVATQINDYSDIEKRNVDYSFIIERAKKNL
jgi:GR25 family glycosyltransferase involved in LPS biosynthesis